MIPLAIHTLPIKLGIYWRSRQIQKAPQQKYMRGKLNTEGSCGRSMPSRPLIKPFGDTSAIGLPAFGPVTRLHPASHIAESACPDPMGRLPNNGISHPGALCGNTNRDSKISCCDPSIGQDNTTYSSINPVTGVFSVLKHSIALRASSTPHPAASTPRIAPDSASDLVQRQCTSPLPGGRSTSRRQASPALHPAKHLAAGAPINNIGPRQTTALPLFHHKADRHQVTAMGHAAGMIVLPSATQAACSRPSCRGWPWGHRYRQIEQTKTLRPARASANRRLELTVDLTHPALTRSDGLK